MDQANRYIKWLDKNRLIVVLVIVTIGLGTFALIKSTNHSESKLAVAQQHYEISNAELLSAGLKVYYAQYRNYPTSLQSLKDDMVTNTKLYGESAAESLGETQKALQSLSYSPRGDMQAYKFTYKGLNDGTIHTVSGDYQKDYQ